LELEEDEEQALRKDLVMAVDALSLNANVGCHNGRTEGPLVNREELEGDQKTG
jgi:hypothetical protein